MSNQKISAEEENATFNIIQEIEKYLRNWKWFFLSVSIATILAFIYLRYATPSYSASASIMIKDNQKSGISQELSAIADLGIVGMGSVNNTDNEIHVINSRRIVGRVVDSLHLNISYIVKGRVATTELYNDSPYFIKFEDYESILQTNDTTLVISSIDSKNFNFLDADGVVLSSHKFNEDISSELGMFQLLTTDKFKGKDESKVFISLNNREITIDYYKDKVAVNPVDKNSSVVALSFSDRIKERAEDFLDALIRQYNLDAIKDKSEVASKTIDFIDQRLSQVYIDLESVQDLVKEYKVENKITGLSKEGEIVLENASRSNEKLIGINTQLMLAESVYKSLQEKKSASETLPQNLGFTDVTIANTIEKYNELVLLKNRLDVNAGKKNPMLIQYISEVEILKSNLNKSISNLIASLKLEIATIENEVSIVNRKLSLIPTLERGYIDIARQQEIISGLYSYLLKKREEMDISLAVTVSNAKIIDSAYSNGLPSSPKRKIIFLAAFLLGIIIPFVIIYLKDLLDTKVHGKNDIENLLSIPFLGDIPISQDKSNSIIDNEQRSSTSEAFRLIRTNLDFMLPNKAKSSKFVFVTSTFGGEGKSFISINLAATLALSGKRILLMGMDLRAPKFTEYLGVENKKGITNYLTDDTLKLDDIKFKFSGVENLEIISSGAIPPNPAELLASKRVETLFSEVKDCSYDFVVLDTAPVSLVTDTLLISKYADMFLYVVRANYTDKRMLSIAEELHSKKRLKNMSIVLNATDPTKGYGYGYGYGYGDLLQKEKPWYKKIFSNT